MTFKTPAFWHKKWSVLSYLLIPVSWVYQILHRLNITRQGQPYTSSIPVICVGNAIAGGGGKTPTVMALVKLIKNQKIAQNPFILTRGYGGDIDTAIRVDPEHHTANDVGDEPLLLAQHAPTIIAKNRAEGAKIAEENGADLIIMDDGLQNNHLHKTLSLLVVDRQIDFGNNRTIPAGPLREPLSKILPKVQGIICIGRAFHSDLDVFEAAITAQSEIDLNQKYIGFAGLAYPEKLKNTLLDMGCDLAAFFPFPDHYTYADQDINKLRARAKSDGARLITTEKDYVRLPPAFQKDVVSLPIALSFQDQTALATFIKDQLHD